MTKIPKKYWPLFEVQCIKCGSYNLKAIWDGQMVLSFHDGNLKLHSLHVDDVEVVMQCLQCDCVFKWFASECYKWTDGSPNMHKPSDTWKDPENDA